jgi:hypothetical protein
MASLDTTSYASALKVHYTSDRMENLVYKDNPLLGIIAKYEKFGGASLPIPIIYGNPTGRSKVFATAQTNKNPSKLKSFSLTRAHDYSLASIDNETLLASQGDANAFMEATTVEIDGAINAAARSLAIDMYRDGTSVRGNINATVTGTTLTLNNTNDITNFEVGMVLEFSSDGTAANLRSGNVTVSSVNRVAGSMVVSANLNTVTSLTSGDYIAAQGDTGVAVKGLQAWLPGTVTATSFFGVDRTADSVRLGGNYYDGSAVPIEEALIQGSVNAAREGGAPDYCFMNYGNWANLEKALGSKVQYVDVKVSADIGFRGIQVAGPRGMIKVIADQNCPNTDAFMLQMDLWKLYSLGKAPMILDSDGNKFLRESSSDGVEVRVGYYAQIGCRAPGFNTRIKLN